MCILTMRFQSGIILHNKSFCAQILYIYEGMVSAVRFTVEEFNIMVNELLQNEPVSFDMLCQIAEKTLRPYVENWCKTDECLRGKQYQDDIMQEIFIRLIKTTVPGFLLHKGTDGEYNNDPGGFNAWMITIALNLKRDFAAKVRGRDFKTKSVDDTVIETIPFPEQENDLQEHIRELKGAFSLVISSGVGIYKVLTWFAQFLFMLEKRVTKIKSNQLIIENFQNRTLYDMYNMLLAASKKIPWIEITQEQNEKLLAELRKKRDDGVLYGEMRYKDFFMKHNGVASGKKSISDWMNRMNDMIRRKAKELARSTEDQN